MAYILSADIGTSSLKAVLFDEKLNIVAEDKCEYQTHFLDGEAVEHDPSDWLNAFRSAVAGILSRSSCRPSDIVAVGICGMSSIALPVDAEGAPLRSAMIWLDRRAKAESEKIAASHGDTQLAICGNRSDPSNFAPKMMWLRDHEPDVYQRAYAVLQSNSFLVRRLTGKVSMDVSEGGMSQLVDLRQGVYSAELVRACGLDAAKLPPIYACTDVVGRVTGEGAGWSGLAAGTPVIAGAMDNVAATVGLQLWNPGDAYVSAGTVTNVGMLLNEPVFDGKGLVYHYGAPNRWLVNGGVDYGGAGLLWFRDILGEKNFSGLDAEAAKAGCGEQPLLFLPYMVGQRAPLWNTDASGMILGVTPATERRHLARMFMESTALGARHVFQQLSERLPDSISLTGGITHNRQWRQIFADAMHRRTRISAQSELSALGAAVMAGIGVGVFHDFPEAFACMPAMEDVEPQPRDAAYYDKVFDIFTDAYNHLSSVYRALSGLRTHSEEIR